MFNNEAFWNAMRDTAPTYRYTARPVFSDAEERNENESKLDEILTKLKNSTRRIRVNVSEDDDAFHVEAALSGVKKENIEITVPEPAALSIKITETEKLADEKKKSITKEITSSYDERIIEFSEKFDSDKITASFENGLLTVTLPKIQKTPVKKISIA